jgi:hypothetical protein
MANDGIRPGFHAGRIATGLVVLALGALMLLDRHGVFDRHNIRLFPGIVLIVLGVVRLLWGDAARRRSFGGVWLVVIGGWLIVNESHLMGLTYEDSWPVLIVAAGVMIVAQGLFGGGGDKPSSDTRMVDR